MVVDTRRCFSSAPEPRDEASTLHERDLWQGKPPRRKAVAWVHRSRDRLDVRGAPSLGEQCPLHALCPAGEENVTLTRAQRIRCRRDLRQRCKGFQAGVLARAPPPPLPLLPLPLPPGLSVAVGNSLKRAELSIDCLARELEICLVGGARQPLGCDLDLEVMEYDVPEPVYELVEDDDPNSGAGEEVQGARALSATEPAGRRPAACGKVGAVRDMNCDEFLEVAQATKRRLPRVQAMPEALLCLCDGVAGAEDEDEDEAYGEGHCDGRSEYLEGRLFYWHDFFVSAPCNRCFENCRGGWKQDHPEFLCVFCDVCFPELIEMLGE